MDFKYVTIALLQFRYRFTKWYYNPIQFNIDKTFLLAKDMYMHYEMGAFVFPMSLSEKGNFSLIDRV